MQVKRKKYLIKQMLIILTLIICLISFTLALGKYVTNNISGFFMKSKEFYFYSDKLSENMSIFQIDNWSGVDDYTIIINMNSSENNLLSATYDIEYDISCVCSSNAICQLSKNEGIIYAENNSDTFSVIVTPNTRFKHSEIKL